MKFQILILMFVESGMLIRIKTELSSFKTLGGVRSRSLKIIFWGVRLSKFCTQWRHWKLYTLHITLLMLLYTITVTVLYTTLNICTIYACYSAFYNINFIHLLYNVTICYDITLLMTIFQLPLASEVLHDVTIVTLLPLTNSIVL